MTYQETLGYLKNKGQEQLLRFYDELDETKQASLLKEIEELDFDSVNIHPEFPDAGAIEPIDALSMAEIEASKAAYKAAGIEAIKAGKVAAVLMAGGQGTRLGLTGPKGTLNVGKTKELYLFQCLINNLTDVVKEAGAYVPMVIMTSDKNDAETRAFFEAHDYFGYDRNYIDFFVQEMAPSTDYDGKIYLEEKHHICLSPNGNGGWFKSLRKSGLADKLKANGVEWLNTFSVDNVIQRMADPSFVGATILSGHPIGAKVVSKATPEEKVGVMCLRGGKPSIVEYYDLTEEMRYQKNPDGTLAYNYGVILNYLFRLSDLEDIEKRNLPLHVVEKKIPHLDEAGNLISPESPNGYKFETLVLDMIEMMSGCLVYEVDRAKEFAPIKNMHGVDSLDSAREALENLGIEL